MGSKLPSPFRNAADNYATASDLARWVPARSTGTLLARQVRLVVVAVGVWALGGSIWSDTAHAGVGNGAAAGGPLEIVSPQAGQVLTSAAVRVVIRERGGANNLRELLGPRNDSSRFRRERGELVGTLTSQQGLRDGRNDVVVVERRTGRPDLVSDRSFYVVRRDEAFARLRMRGSYPRVAEVDVVSGAPAMQLAQRERTVSASLNGRPVSSAIIDTSGTRRTLEVSASQGLRFGVNRLRVEIIEPLNGRYAVVERRFVVPRDRPLAAAGPDRAAQPGADLRLGGTAVSARGGRLRYRWSIVERPAGSTTHLAGLTTARPAFVPDAPGRYVLREIVAESGSAKSSVSQVGKSSADDVSVVVSPPATLYSFAANGFPVNPRGVQIADNLAGSKFYVDPAPGMVQVLTLDRATLLPTGLGNTWCCDQGDHSLAGIAAAVAKADVDQLVILTIPAHRTTLLGTGQFAAFNALLKSIGVDPLRQPDFDDSGEQLTIVGVPGGAPGSGWLLREGVASPAGLGGLLPTQGWLMTDDTTGPGGRLFRFQPMRQPFDLNSPHGPDASNTIRIGSTYVVGHGPVGSPGFQVVEVDPRDLRVVNSADFFLGAPNSDNDELAAMADFINAVHQNADYLAVQGVTNNSGLNAGNQGGWKRVTAALVAMGADPDLFNAPGKYAFFGGTELSRLEVAQSNSSIVLDPKESLHETGTLSGTLRMLPDGYYAPIAGTPGDQSSTLDQTILAPSTPWPYTAAAGDAHAAAYAAAMAYITCHLPSLRQYAPDLRQAYVADPAIRWSVAKGDLDLLHYPGPNWGCQGGNALLPIGQPFSNEEFNGLRRELDGEFGDISDSIAWFDRLKQALILSGDSQGGNVAAIGDAIRAAVSPPASANVLSGVFAVAESLSEVGAAFEIAGDGIAASIGLLATTYDLGSSVATDGVGKPLGQRISDTASALGEGIGANVASASAALDAIRVVAQSDFGRMNALAALRAKATTSESDLESGFTIGANHYFVGQLMPLAFNQVESLQAFPRRNGITPANCKVEVLPPPPPGVNPEPFSSAPAGAWTPFNTEAEQPPDVYIYANVGNDGKNYTGGAPAYPPASVLGPMFTSVNEGGYGFEKSTWLWSQGNPLQVGCQ